ncbi:hypothetical protein GGS23DRAFT_544415 [Durotheca rogersii]|uniref:uncharacterized protein n=1 Tax=Durotheca rogersii TaxID=419775 RepID=UPI00221E5D14|nr:uncharacterized protein GGS23DRAFT_544415 [Durotheca rogersii]KAI5868180.1 hypothetical protein GGS23DRAFT_544415 [Durotheca rogersii]
MFRHGKAFFGSFPFLFSFFLHPISCRYPHKLAGYPVCAVVWFSAVRCSTCFPVKAADTCLLGCPGTSTYIDGMVGDNMRWGTGRFLHTYTNLRMGW